MRDALSGVAVVTGGGRGIGANIARELAAAGMRVAISARTREQVESVAGEIRGLPITADVSKRSDVDEMIGEVERELGPIDLLVANAGLGVDEPNAWEMEPEEWWHVLEVNVLGVYLCCRGVIPSMLERRRGRIVVTGSGASYLPGTKNSAYAASKAAVGRFAEVLAKQLEGRIPVFFFSPGLVRSGMTSNLPDDAPWTPPELAPRLVRALASGGYDALAGRYLHAEHDDVDDLLARIDEIREQDLNAIRLRR